MTFNPDLARERIRFLRARIEDAGRISVDIRCLGEIYWWERQLEWFGGEQ